MKKLTHFDAAGHAQMVDVGDKAITTRIAVAKGEVAMKHETLTHILDRAVEKGDALAIAQLGGIMGAKRTADLIPLCHPLSLSSINVQLRADLENGRVLIEASVRTEGKTGVEMEALTAVSVAALTLYDMCKAVDRGMTIQNIELVSKCGGRSGDYRRSS